jgi:hypothetical protein
VASRFQQLIFAISILLLLWYGTMADHELGHAIATYATGGTVSHLAVNSLSAQENR